MKCVQNDQTYQFKIIDFDESNVELVAVVCHLLQSLKHRAARFVARVCIRVSPCLGLACLCLSVSNIVCLSVFIPGIGSSVCSIINMSWSNLINVLYFSFCHAKVRQ